MLKQKWLYLTLCVRLLRIEDVVSSFLKIKKSTSYTDQQSSLLAVKEAFVPCSIRLALLLSFPILYLHIFLSHMQIPKGTKHVSVCFGVR